MSDSRRQLSDYEGIYVGVALRDPREYSAIAVVGVDVDQVPTSADRYTQWSQKVSYQVVELERFQHVDLHDDIALEGFDALLYYIDIFLF